MLALRCDGTSPEVSLLVQGVDSRLSGFWRPLRYFSLARVVVAGVLLVYPRLMRTAFGIGSGVDGATFVAAAIGYMIAAIVMLLISRPGRFRLETLVFMQVTVDLTALAVLIYAGRGVSDGLAVLLLLPNAGAAILIGQRSALFFAALSSIGLMLIALSQWLRGEATELAIAQAGLIGAALLATVLIVGRLAAMLSAQERLASQRGQDLLNQLSVTQAVISELHDGVLVLGDRGEVRAINRSARVMLAAVEGDDALPGLPSLWSALQRPVSLDPSLSLIVSPDSNGESDDMRPMSAGRVVTFSVLPGANQPERLLRARQLDLPAGGRDTVVVVEDLGRLERRAQQLKLASMGRLSASIAHEIRNPLAAIRHANGLLSEQLDGPAQQRLAGIVEDNCVRINRIIEDVLSISRRGSAAPEPIAAAAFLSRVIAEYVLQSGADPARVECRIESDRPIWFDAGNLRQIILNLLGNALRHSSLAPGAVRITWSRESGASTLSVGDDGPGVPQSVREHLFEPFLTTEARGTGLGLHLTRELCNANAARIRYLPAGDNPPVRSQFIIEPALPPAGHDR
jgi:two-component system sensor histidine kinase PilS (NtrC family)